jgi:hypothetical protein
MAALTVVCSVLTIRLHYKGLREPGNLPDTALVKHLAKVTRMEGYVEELMISTEPVSDTLTDTRCLLPLFCRFFKT